MQLLTLAREDRRVDGLGQERVAEAESAGCLIGAEHTMLDGLAQRLARVTLGQPRDRAKQRVGHVAPRRRRDAQQGLCRTIEPVDTLKQQITEPVRELAARTGRGEQLLGEERVALGAGDDRRRQSRGQGRVGVGVQQGGQLFVLERAKLEDYPRPGAPHAVGKPPHALGRCRLVGAVGEE